MLVPGQRVADRIMAVLGGGDPLDRAQRLLEQMLPLDRDRTGPTKWRRNGCTAHSGLNSPNGAVQKGPPTCSAAIPVGAGWSANWSA
ncbi:hypothetical protein Atai01_77890 [Amycolatopsis taiwanensis]|uniref:Uncharacterized protein n=1 Tax=Amycolatopsis taiwanensis TaxID=342230 RepID=A0A9W6RC12_9PSEU|nr:hypothetical protein Atai01_77890 [Amycolatopsis taiwanensis]